MSSITSRAAAAGVGAKSIALPAMGTGVGGFPMQRAATVMVEEARNAAEAKGSLERIIFVLRDDAAKHAFEEQLRPSSASA